MALLWLKALHIVAVISWMAGMLYLPRLFVYHAETPKESPQSATFKTMEFRLYRYIMGPAMIVTWITGPLLLVLMGYHKDGWAIAKLLAVAGLSAVHGMMAGWMRDFAQDRNRRDAKFFRIMNEVPTALMILIVVLVVVKPF